MAYFFRKKNIINHLDKIWTFDNFIIIGVFILFLRFFLLLSFSFSFFYSISFTFQLPWHIMWIFLVSNLRDFDTVSRERARTIQLQAAYFVINRFCCVFFSFFVYFFILIAHTLIFLCRTLNYKFTGIHFWWKIAEFECCKHFTWSYFILIWRKETLKRYTHSQLLQQRTHIHRKKKAAAAKKCIWKQIFALHTHSLTNTYASTRALTQTHTHTHKQMAHSVRLVIAFTLFMGKYHVILLRARQE